MKISFKITKKRMLCFGILLAAAVVMYAITRYMLWTLLPYAGVLFVVTNIDFDLSDRVPWVWTAILFVLSCKFTEFCVQHVILAPDFFIKTSKHTHLMNVLLILSVYFLFQLILSRPSWSAIAAHCALTAFAYTNYFVYTVRGNEIVYSDLITVGTGLSVVKNYSFVLHDRGAYIIMLSILYVMLVRKIKVKYTWHWLQRIISAALMIALFGYVFQKTANTETQTWEQKGTYQNGFVLNFVLSVRDNFVQPPEGYSASAVKKLEDTYKDADAVQNVTTNENVNNPTIIFIMDESFADLSVLGNLETNVGDYMPFIHSMSENTIKGYTLSSVFGAKTPNSEWEYQTGNSMAFLPSGSVVYQQYMNNTPFSIVSTLKNMGYTTVAMHPYYASGWSRKTVYPKLGYDETYFMDDPAGFFDQTNIMRDYITDQELFDKIINRYNEKKDGESLLITGITMQNHGGYTGTYSNFTPTVTAEPGIFSDVNQYLTCAQATDTAVKNLVEYFEGVDDPVEIVFFGDHQPSLDEYFYRYLNGKGMSGLTMDELENFFKVPFFIWTNYDTDATAIDCTSLNYLSTLTLERANIELPAYNKFLAEMMKTVPAINSRGYYSETTKQFEHLENAIGDEAKWIRNYNILEYNSMFDKDNRSDVFFPYITGESTASDSSAKSGGTAADSSSGEKEGGTSSGSSSSEESKEAAG